MSTPTLTRPGSAPAAPPPGGEPTRSTPVAPRGPSGSAAAAFGARSAAGRTFRTWIGLTLGLTPLFMLISDARWYVVGIGATIVTVGPAWALRLWRSASPARVWQLLPGLILLPFYLTAVCVPTGAIGGIIPSRTTWTQLGLLHDELVTTIARSTAPIASTPGVRLALAALLGVGIVMVDVLCTVLEAPAMVGLVLLPVFVLAGGTVRQPVAAWWFVLAAVGYLLILSTTGPEAKPWGRKIGRRPPGAPPSLVSGRTIGVLAIAAAVVVPLVTGGSGANLIADALHTGSGDGEGKGSGTGGVTQLASLKGSLTRSTPIDLMSVTVTSDNTVEPFYLRQSVLDVFTGRGWIPGRAGSASDLALDGLADDPVRPGIASYDFEANVNVSGLDGRPVTFTDTVGAAGLPRGARWDAAHGTFTDDADVGKGTRYTVKVAQPNPTNAQLEASSDALPPNFPDIWLATPQQIAPLVQSTTEAVVGSQNNAYDKAKALSDFFTDGTHGFTYSLNVPAGDSDDDVVNFLQNKQGFCQQYAAAMALMLRVAGVPSRVVVGYTHVAPDKSGTFTVTTRDAHAWVEAYIGGLGWISFDPTPLTGNDLARAVALPYLAPGGGDPTGGPSGSTGPSTSGSASATSNKTAGVGQDAGATGANPLADSAPNHVGRWVGLWLALAIVLLLLLTPAWMRVTRRRAARRASDAAAPEARFDELRDTCVDLDLDWSPARSPRAVGTWLAGHGVPADVTRPLVTAVEQARYGRTPPAVDARALDTALSTTSAQLRHAATRRDRWRARWWPRSVVLDIRARTRARTDAVRQSFATWSNRPQTTHRGMGGIRRR